MSKGGDSAKTPYEESDNLKSKQQLLLVDLVCEGQIKGPVNGLKSVYLNDTPVEAIDGVYNFHGVEAEWMPGTQDQAPLSGFPATENEVPVSLEVKKNTPIVRTITDRHVDRVRVTVGVSSLFKQKDNGDIVGTEVTLLVQIGAGASWNTIQTVKIKGKTRSQYLRSVIVESPGVVPFNIRVVRATNDSNLSTLVNPTVWTSYTEIYDIRLSYPNTAVVGLKFDSEQFNGVPSRKYDLYGTIIKVPDNYDPESRTYSGLWTGNFKTAYTNNPAWIIYDLITNNRYGLRSYYPNLTADKFTLYSVGQYCDQLIDDGFGGKEPRFTCNCYITDQRQAWEVISDFHSIFRAIPVWTGQQLSVVIDRPADVTNVYTNANVVDGKFNYISSAKKDRFTAVTVKYVDPSNGWKTSTEFISDDVMIRRFGYNIKNVDAFACTSRSQARRVGLWILETSRLEKQSVTFSIARDGIRHLPGDIIGIADSDYAGAVIGGRIKEVDGNTVTLDRDVEIPDVNDTKFSCVDNTTGKLVELKVIAHPEKNKLVLDNTAIANQWSVWSISTSKVKPRLFKALTITEDDDGTFSINAVQHVPEKESIVDNGARFEPLTDSIWKASIPPVEHLQVELTPDSDLFQARITWDTPRTIYDLSFEVVVRQDDRIISRDITRKTEYLASGLQIGKYNVSVRGVNSEGKLGDDTTTLFTIAPPPKPDSLMLTPSNFSVSIRPISSGVVSLGTSYEFFKGFTRQEVESRSNYIGRGIVMIDQDCQSEKEYWYGANAINAVGRSEMIITNTKTLAAVNGAGGWFRIQNYNGVFPDDETATKLFLREFGFYPARDAVLTVYALDGNGNTSYSETKMYDGGRWIIPRSFIDGNLIATGTMRGDRIVAGSEINAPIINGGRIVAGTVVSQGYPPAFELLPDGTLNARNANISGVIRATSGELNNVVINENCKINGTLDANRIIGQLTAVKPVDIRLKGQRVKLFSVRLTRTQQFIAIVGEVSVSFSVTSKNIPGKLYAELSSNKPEVPPLKWECNTPSQNESQTVSIDMGYPVITLPPSNTGEIVEIWIQLNSYRATVRYGITCKGVAILSRDGEGFVD